MNGYSLNPEIPTFMRLLQREGWSTGAFGKDEIIADWELAVAGEEPFRIAPCL